MIYKVLATRIKQKVERRIEDKIEEYQDEFRKSRSTTSQIFLLKYINSNIMLRVSTAIAIELFRVLENLKILRRLRKLIKITLQKTANAGKVNGHMYHR